MRERYDAVIIGAGIAGLVTGNYLLDKGKSVLILERNPYPGGCASSFERRGYRFDAAVHWISQAGKGGIVREILSDFGLKDAVRFDRLPAPPGIWTPSKKISFGFGEDEIIDGFARAFPDERSRLVKFWDEVAETKAQLWRLVKAQPANMAHLDKLLFNLLFPLRFGKIAKYHKKKASEVIGSTFKDPELRRALEVMGIFPDISFVHYAWFNSVGLEGDAYYPHGGMQAVPDALAGRFISSGGEILYKTPAEKI
ncbi:MAG: NAD(P)/FAD-dependent oxidoreductase, partial [Nitrospirota bacterium]